MSSFHDWLVELKNCTTEKQLYKVVQDIANNSKKYRLDHNDIEKLESVGLRRYEEFQRERSAMIKNKKQGFNNFD